MAYQVLARKWRPQDFTHLVGQQPIVTALRNGLAENRIAQAYLFSGIRGVGKTTAARILAKALNCERGTDPDRPAAEPCNECPTCRDITAGSDIDVIEVDAATYSKVEQIRELTESLRYGPARDRYKVVVLDEVHRLSRQAFDALLKIVEEPPSHLVFIFATTESDAVPATILSRCQEFQFRRVPSAVLAQHLKKISDAEQITVSDTALRLIARAGEGSVRDSVALLDQLATFGGGEISEQDASNLLGGLDAAIFLRLLEAILDGEPSTISEVASEIEANGWDPHNVYGQFLAFVRDALLLAMDGRVEAVDLPREEAETLARLVQPRGYENLLRLARLLLDSEPSVRRSEFAMLAAQIAWLRAAELPKLTRIEDLLAGRGGEGGDAPPLSGRGSGGAGVVAARTSPRASAKAAVPSNARAKAATSNRPRDDAPGGEKPGAELAAPKTADQETPREGAAAHAAANAGANGGSDRLGSFLAQLKARSPSLAALLAACGENLRFADGKLHLPRGDGQLDRALGRKHNQEALTRLLAETWGEGSVWEWHDVARAPAGARDEHADDEALRRAREDPAVKAVLEIFDGSKIQSVQTRQPGDRPR